MKIGDKIIVNVPEFYSANVEFWEMVPYQMRVKRFTKRKNNPVVGNAFMSLIFDKHSGKCVSHIKSKHTPKYFQRAYINNHYL